jgi:hypothetical protein
MSDTQAEHGPRQRRAEFGVAIGTAVFGVIVMLGSIQAGIGWADEGPRAGFFPFYVGLVIVIASVVNFVNVAAEMDAKTLFANWGQLRSVVSVVIPTAIYVAAVPFLGIYVSSAVLIGAFMKWFGRYSWIAAILVAVGVPFLTYITFERCFLVPLPKGPIEDLLGL